MFDDDLFRSNHGGKVQNWSSGFASEQQNPIPAINTQNSLRTPPLMDTIKEHNNESDNSNIDSGRDAKDSPHGIRKPPIPSRNTGYKEDVVRRESDVRGHSGHDNPANTSLLNQSLNTSVRLPRSKLNQMDVSISKAMGIKENQNAKAEEGEESCVELNVDENGFLIDENGFPILNDKGEPIKLSEDNIEFLKENGLYEEEFIDEDN